MFPCKITMLHVKSPRLLAKPTLRFPIQGRTPKSYKSVDHFRIENHGLGDPPF